MILMNLDLSFVMLFDEGDSLVFGLNWIHFGNWGVGN